MSAPSRATSNAGLGLAGAARDRLTAEISAVAHCAASITFDLPLEDARRINVTGTHAVMDLASEALARGALERVVHVSTAYVAGERTGQAHESEGYVGQRFRNTYEQVKNDALATMAANAFGREPPRFVGPGADPESEERAGVFAPYFRSRLLFDARRGRALGFTPPPLQQYFGALMQYADRARWGKKPVPRWAMTGGAQLAAA